MSAKILRVGDNRTVGQRQIAVRTICREHAADTIVGMRVAATVAVVDRNGPATPSIPVLALSPPSLFGSGSFTPAQLLVS